MSIALEVARDGEDHAREGEALKFSGILERERHDLAAASERLEGALEIGQRVEDPLLVAETLRERGQLRLTQDRRDLALSDWEEALEGFLALGST